MGINFNPFLRHNDSLSPEEIQEKLNERNAETRELTRKAFEAADVPVSAAENAANHSAVQRQTAEGKKAFRDASTWSKAQNGDKGIMRLTRCSEENDE